MSSTSAVPHLHARPASSFPVNPAVGAMFASLLVVAYAAEASPDGAVRARMILQGIEIILLTLSAGFIAGAVSAIGTAITADASAAFARVRGTAAAGKF